MKKYLFLVITLISFSIITMGSSCTLFCSNGSGNIITEEREVSEIKLIKLSTFAKVHLIQGEDTSLIIQTDDNLTKEFITRVERGMLTIERTNKSKCIKESQELEVWITVPEVEGLMIEGSGEIISENTLTKKDDDMDMRINGSGEMSLDLDVSGFDMHINGSGKLTVHGNAHSYSNFSVDGSGSYDGLDLNSKSARIEINGSGKAKVGETNKLDVKISGDGKVQYLGTPQITQDIAGSGKIEPVIK